MGFRILNEFHRFIQIPGAAPSGAAFFRARMKTSQSRFRVVLLFVFGAILSVSGLTGCQREPDKRTPADRGRTLYTLHCTACHNVNPSRDGSLGPALQGSSFELLKARIIRGEYPEGYTPKRSTHIMQKLPMSEEEVKCLYAYLKGP